MEEPATRTKDMINYQLQEINLCKVTTNMKYRHQISSYTLTVTWKRKIVNMENQSESQKMGSHLTADS